MSPFTRHSGTVAMLDRNNVDTDAIMPKQFMQSLERSGYGRFTFDEWRYLDRGDLNSLQKDRKINPLFELNDPRFLNATILLTRQNFGCGSSREHAVWGLCEYGFKVIIAESFADIFYSNCIKNGLLALVLTPAHFGKIYSKVNESDVLGVSITVDLPAQKIYHGECEFEFEIALADKNKLLVGGDDVTETLSKSEHILAFEEERKFKFPWLFL